MGPGCMTRSCTFGMNAEGLNHRWQHKLDFNEGISGVAVTLLQRLV